MWFRARGEMILSTDEGMPHLVGIAVDITEEKLIADSRKDGRYPRPGSGRNAGGGLCPVRQPVAARHGELEIPESSGAAARTDNPRDAAGRDRTRKRKPPCGYGAARHLLPGNRARAAMKMQLDDGRWFHINERPTRDGGEGGDRVRHFSAQDLRGDAAPNYKALEISVNDLERSKAALQMQALQLAEMAER